MRRILLLFGLLFAVFHLLLAGEAAVCDEKLLPVAVRTFISTHFPEAQVSHVKVEKGFWGVEKYEVLLTDRTEIEFDGKGRWVEVECDRKNVPRGLIPAYADSYIRESFPEVEVVKVERDSKELELELTNGLSLTFNNKGELIDVDD